MEQTASRRSGSSGISTPRLKQVAVAVASVFALAGAGHAAPPQSSTTGKPAAKAGSSSTAAQTSKKASDVAAASKKPVAAKNVAVGQAAVPAAPKAVIDEGCLDAARSDWLTGALGEAEGQAGAEADWRAVVERIEGLQSPTPSRAVPSWQAAALEVAAPLTETPPSVAPLASPRALSCLQFAAVRSPLNGVESLAWMPGEGDGVREPDAPARRVMLVSRDDVGSHARATWLPAADMPAGLREVWLPSADLAAGELAEAVAPRWQRDVQVLVRQMKKLAPGEDAPWVRLVLRGEAEAAQVMAVELVSEDGRRAVDSAIWLEREGAPSGFVSARGGDHERMLWQSPVDYRRISRGVGAATVIVKRRVVAPAKTPGGKPRVVVRSFRRSGEHQGVDFAAPPGTPVVTVAEGTVVLAARNGGYGNLVIVDHGGGITTYYAHLSAFGAGIQEGARVERGQEIGLVGSTGMSTGPHLHFEIRKEGRYLDPADPAQALPNWSLASEEHGAALTRLLALSQSREQSFVRSARGQAFASVPAPAAAPAAAE